MSALLRTILGGRFHGTASTPSPQGRAANSVGQLRQGTQSQRSVKSVRLHGLNNFRNLIRTPRTFIGVLVMTRRVGKDAHEQHTAAARRTTVAEIGRPVTPGSVAGVARRADR